MRPCNEGNEGQGMVWKVRGKSRKRECIEREGGGDRKRGMFYNGRRQRCEIDFVDNLSFITLFTDKGLTDVRFVRVIAQNLQFFTDYSLLIFDLETV
jgi:hypothetical protein